MSTTERLAIFLLLWAADSRERAKKHLCYWLNCAKVCLQQYLLCLSPEREVPTTNNTRWRPLTGSEDAILPKIWSRSSIILLWFSHLDNQSILLKMKGRWKEERQRRKMMICKRWMRRREIYLQRNDNRKGLAKRERDLWAEGSVAELFVSGFFASRQIGSSTPSAQTNYAPWKYGSQK